LKIGPLLVTAQKPRNAHSETAVAHYVCKLQRFRKLGAKIDL